MSHPVRVTFASLVLRGTVMAERHPSEDPVGTTWEYSQFEAQPM